MIPYRTMSRVYGDSTPFPHDVDYIALLDSGVACAVKLASAQVSIVTALGEVEKAEAVEQQQRSELASLLDAIRLATNSQTEKSSARTRSTAESAVAAAAQIVESATGALAADVSQKRAHASSQVESARRASCTAIEEFVANHTPPGSSLGMRLSTVGESCRAQVSIGTPFNLKGVFQVAIPDSHPWARPRRVADLLPGAEIHIPQESGWLSKRVEMTPVRLDRFFIGDAQLSNEGGSFQLRKGMGSGSGFELRLSVKKEAKAVACPIDENGKTENDKQLELLGQDCAIAMKLYKIIVNSMADLYRYRRGMQSARFGNQPIEQIESPLVLADALIRDMAPLTVEISRRSGAPGELVLRRNLDDRRREETYLTHAELLTRIGALPPDLQSVFAPLGLRSPGSSEPSIGPTGGRTTPPRHSGPPPSPRHSRRPSGSGSMRPSSPNSAPPPMTNGPTVTVSENPPPGGSPPPSTARGAGSQGAVAAGGEDTAPGAASQPPAPKGPDQDPNGSPTSAPPSNTSAA